MIALAVRDSSQVAEARRQCAALAERIGFPEPETGRVALVATELATNLVKHAHGGEILAEADEENGGSGIALIALDRGPGIGDIARAARDGHSTAGTAGNGLGAVRRQSEATDIYSLPGLGTAILARLRSGRRPALPSAQVPRWGAVCLAKPGEQASGDNWAVLGQPDGFAVMVADGLGHGPLAAEASSQARQIFLQSPATSAAQAVEAIHRGLRPTRGAAVAVARVDLDAGLVRYAGIGNIAAVLASGDALRRMVSRNGIAGHAAQRIQEFGYPFDRAAGGLLILHSDGVGTGWNLQRYPGLTRADPRLVAAVLYRDFGRGHDDATVVVARLEGEVP